MNPRHSMPKIVAIENINGRLMVELEHPSSDGYCRILSKEECEAQDKNAMDRLALLDACKAVDNEDYPYTGPSWENALKMVRDAINEAEPH